MQFSFFPDVLKILPELMLALLAIMVVVGDLFSGDATEEQRFADAASTTAMGLGLVLILVILQGGFIVNRFIDVQGLDTSAGGVGAFFANILRNLQGVTDATPGTNGFNNNVLLNGAFVVDGLTMMSRLIFITAALVTALLTRDYASTANPAEFYGLLLFSTIGMNLMSGAGEMISAYLALELTSVSLYIMAGYFKGDLRSSEAGIKYYIFGALSSGVLLYGLSLWYGYAAFNKVEHPTAFIKIAEVFAQTGTSSNLLYLALIFIISGLGYKVAVVPFHSWSPDVYQGAPTPVTAFLSTASKTAGCVLLSRVLVNGFGPLAGSASVTSSFGGWASMLAFIAFLTMTYGNLAAITQTNAKRLLAYSSIAHAGFLLLGLIGIYAPGSPGGAFSQFGAQSLIYYLIAYTFTNLGAFGALAAISRVVGGDEMSDLNGLYKRNLGLAVLMAVFVLSLAGIPPLSGFWAKFMVFQAGWESGAIWLVVVAVLNTIISLYYYLRLLKAMFINEPLSEERISVPSGINFSLVISALIVFIMGLIPNFFLPAIDSIRQVASGG
ncbi:MAG TPA: NADH-quinone oxidoreductase subunit N [Herpetosiphonaceae bacterium]